MKCVNCGNKNHDMFMSVRSLKKDGDASGNMMVNPVLAHYKFKRSIFITKTAVDVAKQLAETGQVVPSRPVPYKHEHKSKSPEQRQTNKGKFETAKQTTLIIIGNFKMRPDSPMKGHPRSALGQFHRELRRRCDMLVQDEHNTTKACYLCRNKLEIAQPPERFAQCRCTNACNRFHSKTQDPSHIFDCYRKAPNLPIKFQCSDRILKLSEPHPRHVNRKVVKDIDSSSTGSCISKQNPVSTRLEHLAAPIFRRIYTTRQKIESNRKVPESVKQNLNLHIQRSMYNIYSRLENVKFPHAMDLRRKPLRKSIKSSTQDSENRRVVFERLCQPQRKPRTESPVKLSVEKRPVSMEVIKRLSVPRKIKSAEQINYKVTSRPLQSEEYYEKLSQPRKILEEIINRETEQKLTSMKRTNEIAVPLSRLQRRKFMKGDNEMKFPVSKAALEYKASANIKKLAQPKTDPSESSGKSKKKK
ncbi:hypothetical protein HA402_000151 [Bradysia odoriphaga]|nr:hypothetical protein HA402_000151 [Bradysia odoriphaga]